MLLAGAAALAGVGALAAPAAYAAAARLTAGYVEASSWSTGYGGGYTVTNSGAAVADGWTVEFELPAGSRVTNSWSALRSQTGQRYRFSNASTGRGSPGRTRPTASCLVRS